MKKVIRQVLKEELTASDKKEIKQLAKDEFEKLFKTKEVKEKVEDIVRKQIKNDKATDVEIAKITQKVLVKLFKTFWVRRNFWSNNLENV
jgi:Ethanolamine utilization protein EutJ (predicted chaperonin)